MVQLGSFDTIVKSFRQLLELLPDKRTGKNTQYGMEDAALSAFSVFFTQTPSFLAFQRTIEKNKGKSNAQSLFGVHKIPSDNHIRDLLDPLKPELITPIFEQVFQYFIFTVSYGAGVTGSEIQVTAGTLAYPQNLL